MSPVHNTVGILVISGLFVASALLVSARSGSQAMTNARPTAVGLASANLYLTATPESTHVLRGVSETHVAVAVAAPRTAKIVRPPLSLAIVLDRSGSMGGEKLMQAKSAAAALVRLLEPADSFSVVTYGNEPTVVFPHLFATPANIGQAVDAIAAIEIVGGTNISGGLSAGREELAKGRGEIRRIVLLSDGRATMGLTNSEALAALAGETADRGVSITTVGIGLDFDEANMTAMAIAGRGNYYFAERATDLSAMFTTEIGRVSATAAKDVVVQLLAADGVEITEAYGHELAGGVVKLSDLHASETRPVVFRIRGRFASNGPSKIGTVRLTLTSAETGERIVEESPLSVVVTDDHHAVARGQDADAVVQIERARTAMTLEAATRLYEAGDRSGASSLLQRQAVEANKRASSVGRADLGAELGDIAKDADEALAAEPESESGKSSRKNNRAKSYDLLY